VPVLSWELVVEDFAIPGHDTNVHTLGTAGSFLSGLATRDPIRIDGDPDLAFPFAPHTVGRTGSGART